MDELKKLLGDDLFNQVSTKLGDGSLQLVPKGKKAFLHEEKDNVVISNNGEWVPTSKLKDISDEEKITYRSDYPVEYFA